MSVRQLAQHQTEIYCITYKITELWHKTEKEDVNQ